MITKEGELTMMSIGLGVLVIYLALNTYALSTHLQAITEELRSIRIVLKQMKDG